MFHLLSKHIKLIIGWGMVFAVISFLASLFFPQQYSAETQVLIISRDRGGVDPYTQAKSAERIGENLAQVMLTTDFYNKVLTAGNTNFDKSVWQNLNERDQRKKWVEDVQAQMSYGSSLLNIKAYSRTPDDAKALAQAVTDTVATRGWEYVGGDVAIKVVNNPLVSRWPTRPNYPMNAAAGFAVGMILSSWWVVKYKKHLLNIG